MPTVDVVCVGILVADLFAPPLPQLPHAGELLAVDGFLLTTGGCAANTAVDLAHLGVSAAVIGKVGRDAFGDFIVQDLARHGLAAASIRRSAAQPTSQTVILPVAGEDRRYIHAVGANADFRLDDIDMDLVRAARVLYVGGYLLMPGLEPHALADLLAQARVASVQTVLDVAGVQPGAGLDALRPVLPHTDLFLPNDGEAAALTGCADPDAQAAALLALGARTVAITQGSRGALVRSATERIVQPVFPVEAVDPSGSGDAFDAGCIVGLLEGWPLARTVAFAAACGALACTRLGCTDGIRSRAQVERLVAG